MTSPIPFGAPMREQFLIDPNFKNLNHGSYGTYPKAIQTVLRQFQSEAEARPDVFGRITRAQGIDESRRALADLVKVPVNECVLVKNATTGVNLVLRNLVYQPGDVIIYFDTVYGAVEYGLVALTESTPVQTRKVQYQLPIRHDELVRRFQDVVRSTRAEGLNVRVAVFDTVVSMPGIRFPFERLTEICREEGILSVIDGAHGIGHMPLDLGTLQPDFFTSNCHKWLYTPRGCALLYVPLRNQHHIRTTFPTSWGFIPASSDSTPPKAGKSAFERLFEWTSTTDDTPYLCIPAALHFRQTICGGEDAIYTYLETLANQAADSVAAALGTETMQEPGLQDGEACRLRQCGMTTVRLPIRVVDGAKSVRETEHGAEVPGDMVPVVRDWFLRVLVEEFGTFVPVFVHGGWLWTRLSAQVYLERGDFEWLGGVLRACCQRVAREIVSSVKL
ncbi:pyridoxal phosphate-dependent transferase [Aspergillus avenaceus]|uniref:Pyridoxal phosphate-dependent transferase n=1 Tax=Aspergillus avenaceus TaxID=36643 RepID=A0A5N6TPX0_ASPAV|nr:pyridoxal phosphate-dependent transferase [Aspergillus avenaceus]